MGATWLTVVLFGLVMFLIGGNVALWQIDGKRPGWGFWFLIAAAIFDAVLLVVAVRAQ